MATNVYHHTLTGGNAVTTVTTGQVRSAPLGFPAVLKGTKRERDGKLADAYGLLPEDAVKKLKIMRDGMPTDLFDLLLRSVRKPVKAPLISARPMGSTTSRQVHPAWFKAAVKAGLLLDVIVNKPYAMYVKMIPAPSVDWQQLQAQNWAIQNAVQHNAVYQVYGAGGVAGGYSGYPSGLGGQPLYNTPYVQPQPTLVKQNNMSQKRRYAVSLKGIELLEVAAKKNKEFNKFFAAYCPVKHLDKIKAACVAEKITRDF